MLRGAAGKKEDSTSSAAGVEENEHWTMRTGKKLKGGTRLLQANPRPESMVSPEVSGSDSVDPADTRILTQPTQGQGSEGSANLSSPRTAADPATTMNPEKQMQPVANQPPGSAPLDGGAKAGQIPAFASGPGRPADPKASFHIPNAKAGQSYAGKIEGSDSSGAPVRIREERVPSELVGVEVYEELELRGGPAVGGDDKIGRQWRAERTYGENGE